MHDAPRGRRVVRNLWQQWVKPLAILLLVLGSFRSVVADWHDVPTGSMEPTIEPGDRIVVNKLAYQLHVPLVGWHLVEWADPQRGDVVVLYSPHDGIRLVKRVVAVPGDVVELRRNRLFINGQPAQYAWAAMASAEAVGQETVAGRTYPLQLMPGSPARQTFAPLTVPAGQYFVMGDNRDRSFDSRYFGLVSRGQIAGKAFAVALSVDRERYYAPRWERFFRGLP